MSKIRLFGDSSGFTEIAAADAAGNSTVTLPNSGTIVTNDSDGAVGVTSIKATNAHFSGTTRITTGITTTATITTAKVTTIQDASGGNSSTPEQLEQGRAKAWVHFDGTTNTGGNCDIYDSYNVSSVTDNGTGDYTVNFTGGVLSNANYCVTGSISWGTNQSRNILNVATQQNTSYTAATATAIRLESVNYGNGSAYDANSCSIAVFGG